VDLYAAAVELSAVHRLDLWTIYDELKRNYDGEMPEPHLEPLSARLPSRPARIGFIKRKSKKPSP